MSAACAQIGRAIRTFVTGEQNTDGGRQGEAGRQGDGGVAGAVLDRATLLSVQ